MYILEAIRGLNLGGAETLLVQRLRHRAENERRRTETRDVLNIAPSADHFAGDVVAHSLVTTSDDSIPRGVLHAMRTAKRIPYGSVVVTHSPAAALGFKLAGKRDRRFSLVDVVHNTHYRPVYALLGRALNHRADLCLAVSSEVARASTTAGFRRKQVVLGGVNRATMRQWIETNPDAFADLRATIGVTPADRLVCNVGNLAPRKNQLALIDAAALIDDLQRRHPR